MGERNYYLLETTRNAKPAESERIAIEPKGIYSQSSTWSLLQPHVCILPQPPQAGDSWTINSRTSSPVSLTGRGDVRIEDVTVPAGQFKVAVVVELKTRDATGETVKTVWYARDVGPVKIVRKSPKETLIMELEKVVATGLFRFDESGKLKELTAAELQKSEADSNIIVLDRGKLEDGRPFWVYIRVKPSKYKDFAKASREGRPKRLTDYGTILKYGFDKEVPASVKLAMKQKYGCDDNHMSTLMNELKVTQDLYISQKEAQRIAEIVEMLKKKQGP